MTCDGLHFIAKYLYDGPNSIEEIDNSGNILERYTRGKSVDEPLAELRAGTTSYYHADVCLAKTLSAPEINSLSTPSFLSAKDLL